MEGVAHKLLEAISTFAPLRSPITNAERPTQEELRSTAKLWSVGEIITLHFLDGEPSLQWRVVKSALKWTLYANVKFVFVDEPQALIRITFQREGSWSVLGTTARGVPMDEPTMCF